MIYKQSLKSINEILDSSHHAFIVILITASAAVSDSDWILSSFKLNPAQILIKSGPDLE